MFFIFGTLANLAMAIICHFFSISPNLSSAQRMSYLIPLLLAYVAGKFMLPPREMGAGGRLVLGLMLLASPALVFLLYVQPRFVGGFFTFERLVAVLWIVFIIAQTFLQTMYVYVTIASSGAGDVQSSPPSPAAFSAFTLGGLSVLALVAMLIGFLWGSATLAIWGQSVTLAAIGLEYLLLKNV